MRTFTNPVDRVRAAIIRRPVDHTPCGEIVIDDALVRSFVGRNDVGFAERVEFVRSFGLDLVCLAALVSGDGGGNRLPSAHQVTWPDLDRWVRQTDRFVFVMLDGLMGWGFKLLGWEKFLLAAMKRTNEFEELALAIEALNLALIERAAEEGAMGVLIADDIAYQRGLMMSPTVLRERFFPSLARQVNRARWAKLPTFFHSDGDIREVVDDVVEAGFDGLQGVESAAGMDIGELRRQCGHRLCLWGNLCPSVLLSPPSVADLEPAVAGVVGSTRGQGGLIFGTSSGLVEGMDLESLRLVYELARTLSASA